MKSTICILLAYLLLAVTAIPPPELLGPPKEAFTKLSTLHAVAPPDTGNTNARVIKGYVNNNCPFNIYVQYAWCHGADKLVTLPQGKDFWTSGVARNDRCSQTIRVYKDTSFKSVYQVEYSMDPAGDVWYNLSAVDGQPFNAYARFLVVHDDCKWMYCKPGQGPESCDWPFHEGYCRAGDVKFYLC